MPTAHCRKKHLGQLLRIEFGRIVLRSKITQGITHNFARIGVAAIPDFLRDKFLEIFRQCHLHVPIFPCERADVNQGEP